MASFTRTSLLKLTGCKNLKEIKKLSLANSDLGELDPKLNDLENLEELDIDNNMLKSIKCLNFPKLKILSCQNNLLGNLKCENLPALKEVFLRANLIDNDYNYIIVDQFPNLEKINGKPVDKIRRIIEKAQERCYPEAKAIWNSTAQPKLTADASDANVANILKSFTYDLKRSLQMPDTPTSYFEYKIESLASKFVNEEREKLKLVKKDSNSSKHSSSKKNCIIHKLSPLKKNEKFSSSQKKTLSKQSPLKSKLSLLTDDDDDDDDDDDENEQTSVNTHSVKKRALFFDDKEFSDHTSPMSKKRKADDDITESTSRKRRNVMKESVQVESPKTRKGKNTETPSKSTAKKKITSNKNHLKALSLEFDPSSMLRCHSADNKPSNSTTSIWRAAFEPDPENKNGTTEIVATCGSNIICFIDCSSNCVLKRYKHHNPSEEFFTMAWTILPVRESAKRDTFLAIAGSGMEIHLMHPAQLNVYKSFKAHKQNINTLIFHPENPTQLLSGGDDKMIYLWDIGIPTLPNYESSQKKLLSLSAGLKVLHLSFSSPSLNMVIAACEEGLLGWQLPSTFISAIREPNIKFKLSEWNDPLYDGLSYISDTLIGTKENKKNTIYVWDLVASLGRKTQDIYKKKKVTVNCKVVQELEYARCKTEHLALSSHPSQLLICGDDCGKIWLHNVSNGKKNVIDWPEIEPTDIPNVPTSGKIVINQVAISPSGKYLVACSNKNLVSIFTVNTED